MIGRKKKQPFSLKNTLIIDVGLRLTHASGAPRWQPRVEGLKALGVRQAIVATDPLVLSSKKRASTVHESPEIPYVDDFSIEVLPSYGLDEDLEAYVQEQSLTAYRDKFVMLALHEKAAVRELKGPVFELRARGYEPIILHREPRKFTKLKIPALEYLIDLGCLLQLDLMTLTGAYGQSTKVQAETLLANGLVHILTTGITSIADAELIETLTISANMISPLEQALERHRTWLAEL